MVNRQDVLSFSIPDEHLSVREKEVEDPATQTPALREEVYLSRTRAKGKKIEGPQT